MLCRVPNKNMKQGGNVPLHLVRLAFSDFSKEKTNSASAINLPQSKRKKFAQIPVDPDVLSFLDRNNIGNNFSRSSRRSSKNRREFILQRNKDLDKEKKSVFDKAETRFLKKTSNFEEFPDNATRLPEVALIGRSNCGKSTLVNAILEIGPFRPKKVGFKRRVTPAVVSPKPGETRTLSFYSVVPDTQNRSGFILVDMPGYGFAFAKEEDKAQWNSLITAYIQRRGPCLKRVCLLLDSRHGMKKADEDFLKNLLQSNEQTSRLSPSWELEIIFTKGDLVAREDLARRIKVTEIKMKEAFSHLCNFGKIWAASCKTMGGVTTLQTHFKNA